MSNRLLAGSSAAASLISALLPVLLLPATALAERGRPLGQQPWQLTTDPSTVVLELRRTPTLLGETDRTQTVQVFADGRIEIHQPAYLRAAGDYQGTLNAAELGDLLAQLDRQGLFSLTEQALRQERRAAEVERRSGQQTMFEIHDGMQTSISVKLASYSAADGSLASNLETPLAVTNLQLETDLYPGAVRLAALAAAERTLLALAERADLTPQTTADGRK